MMVTSLMAEHVRAVVRSLGPKIPATPAGIAALRSALLGTLASGGFDDVRRCDIVLERGALVEAVTAGGPGYRDARRRRRARRRLMRAISRGWREPRRVSATFEVWGKGTVRSAGISGTVSV